MLRSILSVVFRNFFRNLSYSIISMGSLVVGLTTALLIFLWVIYELGFDRGQPDKDRIFAVLSNELGDGEIETSEETPAAMADYLANGVPEVESVTRVDGSRKLISFEKKSVIKRGIYADTEYFRIFEPEIVIGNPLNPFPDNHSIVISQGLALLLFERGDAIGKIVALDLHTEFKVTGVFFNFPENSSWNDKDFILPYSARPKSEEWLKLYVKLNRDASREGLERKIDVKLREILGHQDTRALLFPMTDWRLRWSFENGEVSGGRIVYVILFSVTALFILVMACVNYINLATARAAKRAREIGVRKMTGATQAVLASQFMIESLTITFTATNVSLAIGYLILPLFNQLVGITLSFSFTDPLLLAGLFSIALFTGLLAGSYPALLLSSLKPAIVLKGNLYSALIGAGLRKALVIFQFTLSITLIFCAIVMWQQTNYLLKKDLGYDNNHVINVWLNADGLPVEGIKTEILADPSVISAGFGHTSPMEVNGYAEANWQANSSGSPVLLYGTSADHDLLNTLKFKFVQGRNFSREVASDSSNFIITRKTAEVLGFNNPIGQKISYNMFGHQEGEIIGVIEDFHHNDIHSPISPVIFTFSRSNTIINNIFVRYEDDKLEQALLHVKTVFNKFRPGTPLEYSFLDSEFEGQFYNEKLLGNLSIWFNAIAVIIACLGLLGLTIFNAQRRTKEIGIRKVLGASVNQVVIMLCRDFIRPVMFSFLLAFPVAYYLMQKFLEGYAFRITISAFSFLLVGLIMAGLVVLTVSYQSFQAATRNPVESLKTE